MVSFKPSCAGSSLCSCAKLYQLNVIMMEPERCRSTCMTDARCKYVYYESHAGCHKYTGCKTKRIPKYDGIHWKKSSEAGPPQDKNKKAAPNNDDIIKSQLPDAYDSTRYVIPQTKASCSVAGKWRPRDSRTSKFRASRDCSQALGNFIAASPANKSTWSFVALGDSTMWHLVTLGLQNIVRSR